MRHLARRLLPCVALVALVGLAAVWWVPAAPFARFRGLANDPIFPRGRLHDSVLVVAIDERSLREVDGGWPWSRTTVARLVERLDAAGPDAVVLDLLLADTRPDDTVLADAMRAAGNVVLATAPVDARRVAADAPLRTSAFVPPTPVLAEAAAALGASIALPERSDGVLRRAPLVVEDKRLRLVPGLPLAATAIAGGDDPTPILRRGGGIQVGAEAGFPTDDLYRLRISWPAGLLEQPSVVAAVDVLEGSAARRAKGKVVYVGATAPSLGDRWNTPVDRIGGTPGVAVHAAAHHTLASHEFLAPASTTETVGWMLVLAVALVLATRFLPLWLAVVVDIVLVVAAVFAAFQRSTSGVVVDIVDLVAVAVVSVPAAGALRYVTETRLRRRVSALFARYVPEQVARDLVREGRLDEAADGQRLWVSVLFCDLRGFTPFSAQHSPLEVNRMLTAYYEHVTEIALRHGGTVVQYVGDEVFAVFGAPLPMADHAQRALAAADECHRERRDLDRRLAADDLPPASFGISVHSGEVVAVHAGYARRRQYAVVGDTVNIGSRLCGQALAGEVVVSDAARIAAGDVELPDRFEPQLKGVEREIVAWRIPPLADDVAPSASGHA